MGERLETRCSKHPYLHVLLVAAATASFVAPNVVGAPADDEGSADELVEVVVSVGTRVRTRTAADTAVPVDVFNREQVESVNSSDLVDVLNAIVPSFSVRREPISDGASFIRPTHLRGLDTHHTLVLVDGKRRHRGALMRLGGFGATARMWAASRQSPSTASRFCATAPPPSMDLTPSPA